MNDQFEVFVLDDTKYQTKFNKMYNNRTKYKPENLGLVSAFLPGSIREIYVKKGDKVKANQPILVLEAMKMRNIFKAPIDGTVKEIMVTSSEKVAKSQILFEIV
jgi:biotin carboxyl carrier protein